MKLIFISYFDCGIKTFRISFVRPVIFECLLKNLIVSSVKKRSGSDKSQSFWLVNFKKILSSGIDLAVKMLISS